MPKRATRLIELLLLSRLCGAIEMTESVIAAIVMALIALLAML